MVGEKSDHTCPPPEVRFPSFFLLPHYSVVAKVSVYALQERRRAAAEIQCLCSHGGGSTPGVDLSSPFFMELRGHSGRTSLLHQVIIYWILFVGVFVIFILILNSDTHQNAIRFHLFPFLTNSEEAKSTTWLHPVSGEAVITGHRKTPGKNVTKFISICHQAMFFFVLFVLLLFVSNKIDPERQNGLVYFCCC